MNMRHKKSRRQWWNNLTPEQRQAYQDKKIRESLAERATDWKKKAKIDAQAIELLVERMQLFGAEWETNCAIRIPEDVRREIAYGGWEAWLRRNE